MLDFAASQISLANIQGIVAKKIQKSNKLIILYRKQFLHAIQQM